MKKNKKLCKSNKNRMIAGVCGGIAEYFNIDPTIVRLVLVAVALIKGFGFLLYLIAAIVIPAGDSDFEDDIDNLKSANLNEQNEEKNSKNEGEKKESGLHSDQDFNSFFKKNNGK